MAGTGSTLAFLIVALLLGLAKIVDLIVSQIALVPRETRLGRMIPLAKRPPGWTPSYACAHRVRRRWAQRYGCKSRRDTIFGLVVDWLYRAPVLVTVQAVLVFIAVGKIHGKPVADGGCTSTGATAAPDSWLAIATASTAVLVASSMVGVFLVGAVLGPRSGSQPNRMAGQVTRPSEFLEQRTNSRPLPTAVVVPIVAASLILSYACLYVALIAAQPGAFYIHPCWLDGFSSVYFSTVVSATVGFGDIAPRTDFARVVVVTQMFFVVTLFTVFVAQMQSGANSETTPRDI
jgi:hypothetical protein